MTLQIYFFSEIILLLEQAGYIIRRLKSKITPSKYRLLVSRLKSPKVYVDPHIDNLLIFAGQTDLHNNPLFQEGSLILQDKVFKNMHNLSLSLI